MQKRRLRCLRLPLFSDIKKNQAKSLIFLFLMFNSYKDSRADFDSARESAAAEDTAVAEAAEDIADTAAAEAAEDIADTAAAEAVGDIADTADTVDTEPAEDTAYNRD